MVTVLVLHSQRLIREVWTSFLTTRQGIRVVAAAHDLEEAATLARYVKPRVAVVYKNLITSSSVKELGVQLNMSYRTVEVHRYHLLKKWTVSGPPSCCEKCLHGPHTKKKAFQRL